jgi:hypothetical protein
MLLSLAAELGFATTLYYVRPQNIEWQLSGQLIKHSAIGRVDLLCLVREYRSLRDETDKSHL